MFDNHAISIPDAAGFGQLFSPSLAADILSDYEKAMTAYPDRKAQVDEFAAGLPPAVRTALYYLYAFMPPADVITYDVTEIYSYVLAAGRILETIPYSRTVPADLFLPYVLHHRVNNENLDGCRSVFYEELFPRISGLGMKDAILEVNYWCYEKATYIPSDGRTLAPLAIVKTAKGRCGEESTLAVSALRSVGIPARQCYVPRWAHCDDNHAWVEAWADGEWHYLGACEPEPILDKGWFTSAASRSMLVRSRAYTGYLTDSDARRESPLYELVNSTGVYAPVRELRVLVRKDNKGLPGIKVRFELINYSELFPLFTDTTDEAGYASFVTGLGSLHIQAYAEGRVITAPVDVRTCDEVVLDWENGFDPNGMDTPVTSFLELVPPTEQVPKESLSVSDPEKAAAHTARLARCEAIRADYESSFCQEADVQGTDARATDTGTPDASDSSGPGDPERAAAHYRALAKGNHAEIESFLAAESFSIQDKLAILSTLRDKDFVDITSGILCEYLEEALRYREAFLKIEESEDPERGEIFRTDILAPRIDNEMIRPGRRAMRVWAQENAPQLFGADGREVMAFVRDYIRIIPEYGCGGLCADPLRILEQGICGKSDLPVFYVALCRSLGIAARLHPSLRYPEYLTADAQGHPVFVPADAAEEGGNTDGGLIPVTLINRSGQPLRYETHVSIGYFKDGAYETLFFWDLVLEDFHEFQLPPGGCRVITTRRQIDGTVSSLVTYFDSRRTSSLTLELAEDQTARKLKSIPVADTPLLTADTKSPVTLSEVCGSASSFIIYTEPGREPTEHLLQELIEQKDAIRRAGVSVVLINASGAGYDNATLARAVKELGASSCIPVDPAFLPRLRVSMGVGDERLPFALAADPDRNGLFAFANYNIGTAATLLSIVTTKESMRKGG